MKKIVSIALAAMMIMGALVAMPVTSAAATATENWGPEADGIYYIDDANDMLAFNSQAAANDKYNGKTVKLRADIDMSGVAWTPIDTLMGTFDGQNYSIKNLTMSGGAQVAFAKILQNFTIKNVKFVDCSVTGTSVVAVIGTLPSGTVNFENVYISGTVNCGEAAGGFLAKTMGSGRIVNFKNCVSDVSIEATNNNGGFLGYITSNDSQFTFENCVSNASIKGASKNGGFVGSNNATGCSININNCVSNASFEVTGNACAGFVGTLHGVTNSLNMTDCVFAGNLATKTNVVSPVVGFLSANLKLERCISIGNTTTEGYYQYRGALLFLDNENKTCGAKVEIIDCYSVLVAGKAVNASSTSARGVGYDLSITYDGQKVFEHKDSEVEGTLSTSNGMYSKLSQIEAVFKTLGTAEGATLTADNFGQQYPALAKAGWVVTNETVEYATGKTITKIMPASVATMAGKTALVAPNATSYLQIKNGTDGKYDVRFIGAVNVADLDAYESVGFVVVVKLNGTAIMTETVETKAVYTSIKADGVDVTAETLGADYLNVLQIAGFKAENKYDISVLSFAKRADGTVVYDYAGAFEVAVQNGALAE